ncbi:MAG: hypothetical protein ACRDRL_19145 [Sciscionella sp.]
MTQTTISQNNVVLVTQGYASQADSFLVYAECPEGYIPISGGLYSNNQTSQIEESYPDYVNNRWYVRANTFGTITVTAYVICVKA